MEMYKIWKDGLDMPDTASLEAVRAEHICIKPFTPEKDGYVFLHGVALAKFKNRMYCAWAHNKVRENSDDEELNYAVSEDGGYTWSDFVKGNCSPEAGTAVSHGAFLIHEERLYLFAPLFSKMLYPPDGRFRMAAYVLNEESGRFEYVGIVLDEPFWPMCEPVRMKNGSYIMSGMYVADSFRSSDNRAAAAISHGADIFHWDMVKIEKAKDVQVWGECSLIPDGDVFRMYCRESSGKRCALYSESHDCGRSWSVMGSSNLPMIDSKPYAGKLSNGCGYLICSCAKDIAARNPLTIALAKKGEDKFSKIYKIADLNGYALSYPYAIEIDQKLYVAYSSGLMQNRNSAMLAIIDLADLRV